MQTDKIILESARFDLTIERLCHQLIENHDDFSNSCLIGIQSNGKLLADVIHAKLLEIKGLKHIEYGLLDVTFYRDDFRKRPKPLSPHPNHIDFLIEDRRVILVDDVLFTGRTIRAALTALQHYGRAAEIELLVLIDRRFNRHLPIQPDYVGMTVDAVEHEHIEVEFTDAHGRNQVILCPEKR